VKGLGYPEPVLVTNSQCARRQWLSTAILRSKELSLHLYMDVARLRIEFVGIHMAVDAKEVKWTWCQE